MVIPVTPSLGVREIFVGAPVGIGIAQPRQFAALHGVEIAICSASPERLVQAAGERLYTGWSVESFSAIHTSPFRIAIAIRSPGIAAMPLTSSFRSFGKGTVVSL